MYKVLTQNIYNVSGFILMTLGFFTIPLLIGFIIMPIGILLFVFGVHLSLIQLVPDYKKYLQLIINSYKPYLKWKKQ